MAGRARTEAIRGYAQALFSVAQAEDVLDLVEEELFRFARTLEQQPDLRAALTDLHLPAERKRAVLEEVLGGRANPHTINLLAFVAESGRARELEAIVDQLAQLAAERRQSAVAEVRTAVPLDANRRTRLARALEKATGKKIEMKVVVDPSVVGGVVARVGDQVIDGSVRRRLELARERLSEV
ncbi:MAG TPA: ATP synthase F1 subunit delta [Actinomycetota bacterium]|nr:ATP synthase F1 subunit delta [Actinomycetota bacterium]